jgi:FdhE protein
MSATSPMLTGLKRQRPEWEPWLAVVEEVLHEAEVRSWADAVPEIAAGSSAAPRLAGATVALQRNVVQRLFDRLVRRASRSGTRAMATLAHAANAKPDILNLFGAALCQEPDRIAGAAAACGADPEAFQAVAALLPVPFLQACTRSWGSSIPEDWVEPYCPVCGSWPAFAEVRGIERSRYYRCSRCGGEWRAHGLSCPYCATMDHRDLVALVPESPGTSAVVDTCTRCRGYVKTLHRLQGCAPPAVMLEDLAGVALDVAALEHGYSRPAGAAYTLDVLVTDAGTRRRIAGRGIAGRALRGFFET